MKNEKKLTAYLFTPFKFIAGTKALFFGLMAMLAISLLGWLSNTHFDGVLDIHLGSTSGVSSYVPHLVYMLSAWLALTITFYLTALVMKSGNVRLIDIAGTFALARYPFLFVALIGFIPAFHINLGDPSQISMEELSMLIRDNVVMITLSAISMIVFTIWSVILMYNAYTVSTNLKGVKAGISFAIALIISEIISKVLIHFGLGLL